jgi:hypothetical protein
MTAHCAVIRRKISSTRGNDFLVDPLRRELIPGVAQLAEQELHPEFVDLMDDDEVQFVRRDPCVVALQTALKGQQAIELEIVPVVRRGHRSPTGAGRPKREGV